MEFLLRSSVLDSVIKKTLTALPLSPVEPRLKKTLLLRTLQTHIRTTTISAKSVGSLVSEIPMLVSIHGLQATANRSKGNRTDISKAELIQKSSYCRVSDRDMDFLELSAYGNVRHGPDSRGCRIQ
ncbi:hypothetical protein D0Y65_011088 [Glycine soja]|uniref:Uncharacterized protein n=1 Tax=Glycine soja TaxID=3848 RepID=A0A445KIG2_GLYSO|nr:hypothetical protein D0Y65_011088 [Glycine soja]